MATWRRKIPCFYREMDRTSPVDEAKDEDNGEDSQRGPEWSRAEEASAYKPRRWECLGRIDFEPSWEAECGPHTLRGGHTEARRSTSGFWGWQRSKSFCPSRLLKHVEGLGHREGAPTIREPGCHTREITYRWGVERPRCGQKHGRNRAGEFTRCI